MIIQENRSFDNMFYGFPGADTATNGKASNGTVVPLQPISLTVPYDIGHEERHFISAFDGGKMDGFDLEEVGGIGGVGNVSSGPGAPATIGPYPQFGYVPAVERPQYISMASQYVLADRFFPSQIDSSFTAHQFLIAAQTGNVVDNPAPPIWGCDAAAGTVVPTLNADRSQGPGIFPCFDYRTLADELDAALLTWRYYAPPISSGGIWSAYDAIRHIRQSADWTQDVISPETRVLDDLAAGHLANVTWIIPDGANSDHSGIEKATGPEWVSSIVNAVGTSSFWPSTAIIVLWDDWGGWYDHVAPPQLDVHGLGIRTPLMVISPYAKRGYVSHVQYESGSVTRFIETQFGLPPLATADVRANDLGNCFTLVPSSGTFSRFAVRHSPDFFQREPPSLRAPDSD